MALLDLLLSVRVRRLFFQLLVFLVLLLLEFLPLLLLLGVHLFLLLLLFSVEVGISGVGRSWTLNRREFVRMHGCT